MEKIKSVLSGHKKSEDAPQDVHTSTGASAHHEDQPHPIYDQMASGTSSTQPTTATSAHQTASGPHGATAGSSARPGAGAGAGADGLSDASIKSGVIGFGAGERQGHAALPSHQNPEANLDTNQIVGGGNAPGPTTADTSNQPSVLNSAIPLAANSSSDESRHVSSTGALDSTTNTSAAQQPYESSMRRESYIKDTDRSFPLAGGVAPKHDISTTPNPVTSARVQDTKERDVGGRDSHGREALAGAAAAATTIGVTAPLSQSHQQHVNEKGPETRQAAYGTEQPVVPNTGSSSMSTSQTTQNFHPEALAAATAAAAKSSAMSSSTNQRGIGAHSSSVADTARVSNTGATSAARAATAGSYDARYTDPGRPPGGRSLSYRHVPGGFPTPTPDESKTYLFYRDEVVPGPGIDEPTISGVPSTKGTPWGEHQLGRNTDHTIAAPISGGSTADGETSTITSGQHELRHTGSLDHPEARSAEHADGHHHGRDAAIAGGVAAGAAGLGYAATHKQEEPSVIGGTLPHESSPYSSKQLDPRVLGSQAKLEDQRFDPNANSEPALHSLPDAAPAGAASTTHQHHDEKLGNESSSSGPHKSSLLNKLDPRVKNDSSKTSGTATTGKQNESEHYHGRDAALLGGGVATAAAVHHELHRDATTETHEQPLTATSPSQSSASAPLPLAGTASNVPEHIVHGTAATSHPASTKKYEPYQGPLTTSGSPFYGTAGAQAPVMEDQSSPSHVPTSTVPVTQHQDSQHHYGRDAGLAGAGLATAGGLAYAGHRDDKTDTGPASNTLGPHSSNIVNVLDPRVQPDPSKQIHHNVGPTSEDPASRTIGPHQSNVANVLDPRVQPDPSKQKAHTTTGPHQSDTLNRLDPKVDEKASQQDQQHLGRDTAMVGGAAAGYGAHEAYGDHRSTQPGSSINEQRYNISNDHSGRNIALGSGAAAAGGAAYAYTQQSDAERERARLEKEQTDRLRKDQHAQEKELHKLDKEHAKQEKEAHKLDKEQHKHDKAILAAEKHEHKYEKKQAKEAHGLEKEREKEAARLEKEGEKEVGTPEKKHGILGFLHRDKSKKEKSSADNSPRHSTEYAAGGAVALGAGTAAAAHDDNHPDSPRWKGKNKLHKDPPKSHPAHDTLHHHEMGEVGGKRQHIGIDGPIGDANSISGIHETRHNVFGAEPLSQDPGTLK